jgi:hypothetical protein
VDAIPCRPADRAIGGFIRMTDGVVACRLMPGGMVTRAVLERVCRRWVQEPQAETGGEVDKTHIELPVALTVLQAETAVVNGDA